jgi:hypothetical protein
MTPESLQMLFALLIGFAVPGSSGYQVFTSRLPSFSQLSTGSPRVSPVARRVGAVSDHAQYHPRPVSLKAAVSSS